MIPWANFDNGTRNDVPSVLRLQLHEHWLAWVEEESSTTDDFLNSPMLEVAHERQFVISQIGGESAEFEDEHKRRIEICINQLDDHFHNFAAEDTCRPGSPFMMDLLHCWQPETSLDTLPPFNLISTPSSGFQDLDTDSSLSSTSTIKAASTPTPSRKRINSVRTVLEPEIDTDEGEISDSSAELFKKAVLQRPRTTTTLPIHSARAQKPVRQRARFDSKLANASSLFGKKRGSQWMLDEDDDDITIAARNQTLASRRAGYDYESVNSTSLNSPCLGTT